MSYYSRFIFPLLCRFDPERVHDLVIRLLEVGQDSAVGRAILKGIAGSLPSENTRICELDFPNRIGLAAGYDKDAKVIQAMGLLGFGHIELGTLTPSEQLGNPKPRIFRLLDQKALINRMGFPSEGVDRSAERLAKLPAEKRRFIIGVSIGKQLETPLIKAADDYVRVMEGVHKHADYLALNVSSPNTPELRELQKSRYLDDLLLRINQANSRLAEESNTPVRPIFLKISPDLDWHELDAVLDISTSHGICGIIATNTTLGRTGIDSYWKDQRGGLSGRPLNARSNEIIAYIKRQTEDNLVIIGVGGVFSGDDVRRMLDSGASLVQIYTGLVFEGPGLVGRILRELHTSSRV